MNDTNKERAAYPSLYEVTGSIADINTLLVPRSEVAAKAPAAPAPTEQWMPIADAPKDGIWQDGNNHYAEYILAWYPGALRPMRARWWFRDDSDACNFLADGGYAVFPTMYQPLPAPPQGAAKGGEHAKA